MEFFIRESAVRAGTPPAQTGEEKTPPLKLSVPPGCQMLQRKQANPAVK